MAGALTISTLNNDTGVLATQNGMTGIAKAWVNFVGTTAAINGSFNVSSVTKVGGGDFTVNFTTAMPNANYVIAGTAQSAAGTIPSVYVKTGVAPTTTTCPIYTANTAGSTLYDFPLNFVVIFSS
jgi:hypothetical protein